jgi:hypothetical protein
VRSDVPSQAKSIVAARATPPMASDFHPMFWRCAARATARYIAPVSM